MLKKMRLGGIVLASLLAATGCQNEEIVSNNQQKGNYSLTVNRLVDSRTYVEDDGTVVWSKGDKLYVYGEGVSGMLTLDDADAGETTGTFTGFVFGNPDDLQWAVFGDNVKGTNDGAQFTISEISDPNSNSPMVGPIKNGDVQMEHLCGMVRITINNLPEGADVKLKGTDIGGTAEVKDGVLQTPTYKNEIAIKVAKGNQTIEIPVFASETETDIDLTLSVNNKECSINAPVKIGSLSQNAIMAITCTIDKDGNVTGLSQAATTEESLQQVLQSEDDATFELGANITVTESLTIANNATIDLNGFELNLPENSVEVEEGASLTITGTGVVNGSDPSEYLADGYRAVESDEKYYVVPGEESENIAIATSSEKLSEAISAVEKDGDNVIYLSTDDFAGNIDLTVADKPNQAGANIVFKAMEGTTPVITGTVTLGYRNQGVASAMWNGDVVFEGVTFDHTEVGQHSIDVQDVKSLTLINCTIIGDGETGIGSARGNGTGTSKIIGCKFENAGMQILGNFGTGLVIDECEFNESCINVQAGNSVTVKNCTFNKTLKESHVNDSFYLVRSNDNEMTIENCTMNVDSELTKIATEQPKWAVLWQRLMVQQNGQ